MVNVQTFMDSVGTTAENIPTGTAFVGAYVSGTGPVPWSETEIARFPQGSVVRIYQGAGTYPGIGGYDEMDVEAGAITVAQAVSEGEKRVQNGYQWTVIYGTQASLEAVGAGLAALGASIFGGHFAAFVADWNLNESEAEAMLGTTVGGMGVVGVQWASPSSNPNTVCPGTDKTLKELNIDLSVVDAGFFNAYKIPVTPPPPPTETINGVVVYESTDGAYKSADATSADGGKTWSV